MENEIIRILTKDGVLITKEKKSFTSGLPIITTKENCFGNILKADELEKMFENLKDVHNKTIEYVIRKISEGRMIFDEIVDSLKNNNNLERDNRKAILYSLEEAIKKSGKREKERTKVYEGLKKAQLEIADDQSENNMIANTYIALFNKFYVKQEIENLRIVVENALYKKENDNIGKFVFMLKQAQNRENLIDIMNYIYSMNSNSERVLRLQKFFNYSSDLALSVMVKEILKNYVDSQISKLKKCDKKIIGSKIKDERDLYALITKLDSNFEKGQTDNGVIEYILKIFHDEFYYSLEHDNNTLCWDCKNGYVKKCKKIKDREKKAIEDYPFIVSGYQVIKNEKVDKFIITECKNFKKASNKNAMTKQELQEAKAKLAALYYGTETLKEGLTLQDEKRKSIGRR